MYQGQNSNQAIISRLNQAKPVEDRDPYIGEGVHTLCVQNLFDYNSKKHGDSVGLTAVVVESTNPQHQPGTRAFCGFFPNKKPNFIGDQQELDRLVDFCGKLKGKDLTLPQAVEASYECLDQQVQAQQRFRGYVIKCEVRRITDKVKRDGSVSKPFYEKTWTALPNPPEQVASYRARVEASPGFEHYQARQVPQNQPPPQGQWQQSPQNQSAQPPQNQPPQGQWQQQPPAQTWGAPPPTNSKPPTW